MTDEPIDLNQYKKLRKNYNLLEIFFVVSVLTISAIIAYAFLNNF